ncbi:MAG TPA: MerR family transcriptional regulator [Streptosporangiaceae bacterium]|nr:MerR family transcriptional regulator [Streptosporangiaceae bacterium]
MAVLTIGEFARAARLSPKALRLYDELGLLTPARVDPVSGYRFYEPGQLERARLVAWLRRLGMPLTRIRAVCDLPPAAAAAEVAAFWAQAEADLASRRDLAAALIRQLTAKETAMTASSPTLAIRYAAASDIGRSRPVNQDSAYASSRLLAVADGTGGAGDRASAAAIDALKSLEALPPDLALGPVVTPRRVVTPPPAAAGGPRAPAAGPGDLLSALAQAVQQAEAAVQDIAAAGPDQRGSGTTLTALLWSGSQLALVHVGDTRCYLLRDGELFQITHDHTVVQSLIDQGRLTAEEARSHPERALLLRALDGTGAAVPDLSLHDVRPADRYLLCSDGLTTVVPAGRIHQVLGGAAGPGAAVRQLIDLANAGGGPDNIACVVADIVEAAGPGTLGDE